MNESFAYVAPSEACELGGAHTGEQEDGKRGYAVCRSAGHEACSFIRGEYVDAIMRAGGVPAQPYRTVKTGVVPDARPS